MGDVSRAVRELGMDRLVRNGDTEILPATVSESGNCILALPEGGLMLIATAPFIAGWRVVATKGHVFGDI